jgi:ribosomal protein S18 acetylase RimI-like enzyme
MFARPALEKPPEAIVQSLVVDVEARSDGVGRALIGAVENWAKQQGLASVSLSSQVDREDAHAFYDSLGYERVATSSLLRKRLES